MRNILRVFGLTLAVAVLSAAQTNHAHAQVMERELDSTGKGAIGLGLIGAELGLAIPALIGVDEIWPYIVFPVVGAAGGAIGGYFGIDANNQQEAGVAVLVTGIALVLPTVVLTVGALKYDPEDEDGVVSEGDQANEPSEVEESGAPEDDAALDGDAPSNAAPASPPPASTPTSMRRVRRAPMAAARRATHFSGGTGLFRLSPGGLQFGFPGIRTTQAYTLEEMRVMGLSQRDQRAELHVDLFTAAF